MILTIRTDKPEAEIGLYQGRKEIAYKTWQAHRMLSTTVHKVIEELLQAAGKSWSDIRGIVYYEGPGSFTGLRIGAAVANALTYALGIPVSTNHGANWQEKGIEALDSGVNLPAIPQYGSEPHITRQKK
jgi:tRNA threonylcarbamoyladenosine biosynthesis protein TsaB